ncbi:MAG: hypothetical protein FJ148_21455 [Deltaproteobacteria bacterium]|nr:hypothetical protein [Deltaproteobacteria bacterium]
MNLRYSASSHALVLASSILLAAAAQQAGAAGTSASGAAGIVQVAGAASAVAEEVAGDAPDDPAPAALAPDPGASPSPRKREEPRDYYVRARGYRIVPDTDPPRYVRATSRADVPLLRDVDWLDFGLEHRMRSEYRDDSFLRTPQEGQDYPFLLRSRMFFGVKKIFDPFRFAFELQDSR